jgi:hypothetical protein
LKARLTSDDHSALNSRDWIARVPYFFMGLSAVAGAIVLLLFLLAFRWAWDSDDGSESQSIYRVGTPRDPVLNDGLTSPKVLEQGLIALGRTAIEIQKNAGSILESTRGVKSLPMLLKRLEDVDDLIRWHAKILEEVRSAPKLNVTEQYLVEVRDAVRRIAQGQQRLEGAVARSSIATPRPISAPSASTRSTNTQPVRSQPQAGGQDPREPELIRRLVDASNQVLGRALTQAKFRDEFGAIWVTRSADRRLLATNREPGGQMADGFLLVRTERAVRAVGTQRGFLVPGLNFFDRRSALSDPRAVQAVFEGVFEIQETSGDRLIEPATVSVDGETIKVIKKGILQFGR